MAVLNIDELLRPIPGPDPCGLDLGSASKEIQELEAATERRRLSPTEVIEPDWSKVLRMAQDLLRASSKDLRVAAHLVRAALATKGFEGLSDGLEVLHRLIQNHWDKLYPRVEAHEEDDDEAVAIVRQRRCLILDLLLNGADKTLYLVDTRPEVTAGFSGLAEGDLRRHLGSLERSLKAISEVENTFNKPQEDDEETTDAEPSDDAESKKKAAPEIQLSLIGLQNKLQDIRDTIAVQLPEVPTDGDKVEKVGTDDDDRSKKSLVDEGRNGQPCGVLHSRKDVDIVLERLEEYYRDEEPWSPIWPLVLLARKLSSKSFFEIVDLLPTSLLNELKKLTATETQKK